MADYRRENGGLYKRKWRLIEEKMADYRRENGGL